MNFAQARQRPVSCLSQHQNRLDNLDILLSIPLAVASCCKLLIARPLSFWSAVRRLAKRFCRMDAEKIMNFSAQRRSQGAPSNRGEEPARGSSPFRGGTAST
eukprot:8180611-Karenia_brevis.AAC.1